MINSQISHIHNECFYKNGNDWYKNQVLSSRNHSMNNKLVFYSSGGLNYQIEHHLFPSINHEYYPIIAKHIQSVCKKHNVSYEYFNNYQDAFISYYNNLSILSLPNE